MWKSIKLIKYENQRPSDSQVIIMQKKKEIFWAELESSRSKYMLKWFDIDCSSIAWNGEYLSYQSN